MEARILQYCKNGNNDVYERGQWVERLAKFYDGMFFVVESRNNVAREHTS